MTERSSLKSFIDRHRRLFVLTGAGCSTSSGIPDYRDGDGQWKRMPPVTYQAFMGDEPRASVIGRAACSDGGDSAGPCRTIRIALWPGSRRWAEPSCF